MENKLPSLFKCCNLSRMDLNINLLIKFLRLLITYQPYNKLLNAIENLFLHNIVFIINNSINSFNKK